MKSKKAREAVRSPAAPHRAVPVRARMKSHHVEADLRQQLVEQFLAVLEMIVEGALRDAGFFGDAGDGGFGIAMFADDLGRGVERSSAWSRRCARRG